jgi:hypothetical protein
MRLAIQTFNLITCSLLIPSIFSFTATGTSSQGTLRLSSSILKSTTEAKPAEMTTFPEYSEEQLKAALDGLLEGSSDPAFDGRHLFGTGDPNHKLSKLQSISATRILDYQTFLVSEWELEWYYNITWK